MAAEAGTFDFGVRMRSRFDGMNRGGVAFAAVLNGAAGAKKRAMI